MENPMKKSDFIQSVLALPKATCAWNRLIIISLLTLLFSFLAPLNAASRGWDIKTLTVDGNEGIDIADFNNDGKLDVIAGRNWYPAPDFVPHPVRTIEDWNGYVQSNGDFAHDVNGDGLTDVISFSFLPTEVHWYENPGIDALKLGKMWPKHLLQDTENSRNEGVLMHDLDGDGIPELVVNSWGKEQPLLAWKFSTEERDVKEMRGRALVTVRKEVPALQKIMIGTDDNGHGLGFGDINGDGHEDLLFEAGWYERPASNAMTTAWKYHDDWFIHGSVPMLCRDMNKDGKMDILVGHGHDYGLHWWEQLEPKDGKTQWKEHLIDDSFSLPHALHWADLDGDGEDELITGKRFHAHNGRDPGGQDQPCIYYYTWNPNKLKFTRHTIEEGSVGIGLQIRTADINDDGKLDIAVAGKSGTYILFNMGK
jgi:hypothetical protein